jgi:Tol biopolymer transport system component
MVAVDAYTKPPRSYIAISGPGGRRPYRHLTDGPSDHSPACRPDGSSVVFVREEHPPRADLYVIGMQPGSEPRRLSPGRHPSFSPDGEWIAFAAPAGRELRIWRVRPDGTGRAPIGHGIRHEARPVFSPDGTLVAYVAAEERPRRHLYVRRFDGSGDRILFADGDGEYPVW